MSEAARVFPREPSSSAAAALGAAVRPVEVWPGCVHVLARAEAVVIASPPFQRLRRLRQMGLAFHAWPNAENTRASHSLGVAYWAGAYLQALERAPDAPTQDLLAAARRDLGDLSLDLVLRLFALLHDIDLLPLGHTLRYQSGAFAEPPGRPRLAACVKAIGAAAAADAFADAPTPEARAAWLLAFRRHLDAAAAILAGSGSVAGRLVEELVNSGLGSDLVDFALRDSAAITRPQAYPAGLADALRLVRTPDGAGLALALGEAFEAAERVVIADDLYRARFEVFAGSVYHPVKLAADAMLDFVLRRLGPADLRRLLPEDRLVEMGDDELLDALAAAEAPIAVRLGAPQVAAALRAGAIHAEVWRTEDLAGFARRPGAEQALSLDPAWRSQAEADLRARLPGLADGDLIVAVSAPSMQAKPANARLCRGDDVFDLAMAGAHGFDVGAAATAARYARLWSLRVCLSSRAAGQADAARRVAAALFGALSP